MAATAPSSAPVMIQWVLDTRSLWPSAQQTRDLSTVVRPVSKPSRPLQFAPEVDAAGETS